MNRFPAQNLFQPTHNMEALLPVLAIVFIALLFIFAAAGIAYIWRAQHSLRMEWKRFEITANRFRLAPREVGMLRQIVKHGGVNPALKIFRDQARFESAVKATKAANRYVPPRIIESLRDKLFNQTQAKARLAGNTQGLLPGTEMTIRNINHGGKVFHGKLLDNESMGLIVAITSNMSERAAIHPKNRLNVTAALDDKKTVYFTTTVESIIPGPRKIAVLKHAEFISPRMPARTPATAANPLIERTRPRGMAALSRV